MFDNRSLVRLIIPLVIEQFLAIAIGMADTLMVSNVGEAAVSAISLVDTINCLLIQVFAAMATGGAVVASQYIGARKHTEARETAKQLLYVSTAIAIVIGALAAIFAGTILDTVYGNLEEAVMRNAIIYMRLSAASYPFLAAYNAGAALFRSMGNSRISMLISLLMNVMNVAGNALLIYVFKLGVAGAAISSLISRAAAAVVVVILIQNRHNILYIDRLTRYRFHPGIVRGILRIGVPNGLENGLFQVGKLIVARVIAGFGTAVITANALTNNVASFVCIPGNAIGLALITVVGQCVGAKRIDEAQYNLRKLMNASYVFIFFLDIGLFFGAGNALSLFGVSDEAKRIALRLCREYAIFSVIMHPMSFTFPNALRAAGDARYTMWVSIISMLIFRIAMCYLFCYVWNLELYGVWYAMYVDWFVRIVSFIIRYRKGGWKTKALAV